MEFLEQWLFFKLCEYPQFGASVRSIPAVHCWERPSKSVSAWSLGFPLATSSRCVKWDQPQAKVRGKHREEGVKRQGRRCSSGWEMGRQAHLGAGWVEPRWGKPRVWRRGLRAPHSRRFGERATLETSGCSSSFSTPIHCLWGQRAASLRTASGESWRGWERSRSRSPRLQPPPERLGAGTRSGAPQRPWPWLRSDPSCPRAPLSRRSR